MGQPKPKAVEGTVVQLPVRRPLTAKQERFARLYVELGNASEAYRRAYDAGEMQPEAVHVEASRLLADPKVTLRAQQIEAEALAATKLTIGFLVSEGVQILDTAKAQGDTRAATAALTLLGRLHERLSPDVANQDRRSVDDLTDDELAAIVAQRKRPDEDRARAIELLARLGCVPTSPDAAKLEEFPVLRAAQAPGSEP